MAADVWIEGLAALGCTFIPLIPGEKRPRRKLDHYRNCVGSVGETRAKQWLGRGLNVGLLPGEGLWVLDCDSRHFLDRVQELLVEARILAPWVRTPGGGGHFYFRFPESFPRERLKCSLNHPRDSDGERLPCDFKLHGHSLIVLPGSKSLKEEGWVYYQAMGPWFSPPTVDPRMFLPEGAFWYPDEPRAVDIRPWMPCQRPLEERLMQARAYLEHRAHPCKAGQHARIKLANIATHIVQYLGIHPRAAADLMLRSHWNERCQDGKTGAPWPWSESELRSACKVATSAVPEAGVRELARHEARQARMARLKGVVALLANCLTQPDSERVPVGKVRKCFDRFGVSGSVGVLSGAAPKKLGAIELGDELQAQGVKRVKATRKRIMCVPGLDYAALQGSILEEKRRQMDKGCPLLREAERGASALLKEEGCLSTLLEGAGREPSVGNAHSEVAA